MSGEGESAGDRQGAPDAWVELDARPLSELEGIVLRLQWRRRDGAVALALGREGRWLVAPVPRSRAAHAFQNPGPYLARRRSRRPTLGHSELPEPAGVDVDELWLSDLAAVALAELSQHLSERAEEGRRGRPGV